MKLETKLMCCKECDEVCSIPFPHETGHYMCPNCGHTLFRYRENMIEQIYALSLSSLLLILLSNYFPLLSFSIMGNVSHATFITSIHYMYLDGDFIMAGVVFATTIVIPFLLILFTLAIVVPLYHGKLPSYTIDLLKILTYIKPWVMLDVFLVGVLVSIVKLVKMGAIIPGVSLWAFAALIITMTRTHIVFEPHIIWDLVDKESDIGEKS